MNIFYTVLLQTITLEKFYGLLTGAGSVAIILFLLKWLRFSRKDVSELDREQAETSKLKAEAAETQAKADILITDGALKLAQRLSEECDFTKKKLDMTQLNLDKALESLEKATLELRKVQEELRLERNKNKKMIEEIIVLTAELQKLKSKNG